MTTDEHIAALIAAGVSIDTIISAYGGYHAEGLQDYVHAVEYDDELEEAGNPGSGGFGMVSEGADPGAWVLCWVWVTNEQAGIEDQASCERCGEEHPEGVLDDGLCPRCADVVASEEAEEDEED